MADLETRVDRLENRVTSIEQQVSNLATTVNLFIAESRAAHERHDAEIRELRQRQDAAQAKHDADMKEMQKNIYAKMDTMDAKIDGMGKHVRNVSVATIIGIAAMVVAVFLK